MPLSGMSAIGNTVPIVWLVSNFRPSVIIKCPDKLFMFLSITWDRWKYSNISSPGIVMFAHLFIIVLCNACMSLLVSLSLKIPDLRKTLLSHGISGIGFPALEWTGGWQRLINK